MLGPTLGGWLYEIGGIRLPFVVVAALALPAPARFLLTPVAAHRQPAEAVPSALVRRADPGRRRVRRRGRRRSARRIAMLEPVLSLFFNRRLGLSPAAVGLLFGAAAVRRRSSCTRSVGRLADRGRAAPDPCSVWC